MPRLVIAPRENLYDLSGNFIDDKWDGNAAAIYNLDDDGTIILVEFPGGRIIKEGKWTANEWDLQITWNPQGKAAASTVEKYEIECIENDGMWLKSPKKKKAEAFWWRRY